MSGEFERVRVSLQRFQSLRTWVDDRVASSGLDSLPAEDLQNDEGLEPELKQELVKRLRGEEAELAETT